MFTFSFHPASRYNPKFSIEIYPFPTSTRCLGGTNKSKKLPFNQAASWEGKIRDHQRMHKLSQFLRPQRWHVLLFRFFKRNFNARGRISINQPCVSCLNWYTLLAHILKYTNSCTNHLWIQADRL
ncbi:hypothetical protein FBY13_11485 [Pantoea sp. SJZ147]|nr:hypothetical protein FBY13_11485 [Pantoea sp. SJZ147]